MKEYFYHQSDVKTYFFHDGVEGMKWGQRRYQNPDGTWTEEGLERRRAQYRNTKQPLWKKIARGVNAASGVGAAAVGAGTASKAAFKNAETRDRAFKPGKDDKPSAYSKTIGSSKSIIDETRNIDRQLEGDYRDKIETNDLSNKELREMIERLRLEKDYKDLSYKDVNKGSDAIKQILEVTGSLAAIGASTAVIITKIREIRGR